MQARERYRNTNGLSVTEIGSDVGASHAAEVYAKELGESGSVITHIDLDGFYAAVERRRLGRPEDACIAVNQWGSLIAVDYNCRPFGVKRGMTVEEAMKLCPQLECVHVEVITATDSSSSTTPVQVDNLESQSPSTSSSTTETNRSVGKVSLARYRRASFEVLHLFESFTNKNGGTVQRASIDESYIDLTVPVEKLLHKATIESRNSSKDLLEHLNLPSLLKDTCVIGKLNCTTCPLDLRLAIASKLVSSIRKDVQDTLGFTVSAGIAASKLIAKIGSSRNKPNKQTLVPTMSSPLVLRPLPLRGIPGLGGKAGKTLESKLKSYGRRRKHSNATGSGEMNSSYGAMEKEVDQPTLCGEVQDFGERALCEMFPGNESFARSIFFKCLGLSDEKVEYCVRPKSLLSMKSHRIDDFSKLDKFLYLLAKDLVSRLEEDMSMFHRKAKTLVVHHRKPGSYVCVTVRGRLPRASDSSSFIPSAKDLVRAAKTLLESRLKAHSILPCTRMGLSAETFEDLPDEKASITKFFSKLGSKTSLSGDGIPILEDGKESVAVIADGTEASETASSRIQMDRPSDRATDAPRESSQHFEGTERIPVVASKSFLCHKCQKTVRCELREEHMDYHLALDLQAEEGKLVRAAAGGRNPHERLAARSSGSSNGNRKRKKGTLFAAFAKQARRSASK